MKDPVYVLSYFLDSSPDRSRGLRVGRGIDGLFNEECQKSIGLDTIEYMFREINFWKNHLNDSTKADALLGLMKIVAETSTVVDYITKRAEIAVNFIDGDLVLVE